jgi:hypothetical protein
MLLVAILVARGDQCWAIKIKEVRETHDRGNGCRLILTPSNNASPFIMGSYCQDSRASISPVPPFQRHTFYSNGTCFVSFSNIVYLEESVSCFWGVCTQTRSWNLFQISFQLPNDDETLCTLAEISSKAELTSHTTESNVKSFIWHFVPIINNDHVRVAIFYLAPDQSSMIDVPAEEKDPFMVFVVQGELIDLKEPHNNIPEGSLLVLDTDRSSGAVKFRAGNNGCHALYLQGKKVDLNEESLMLFP